MKLYKFFPRSTIIKYSKQIAFSLSGLLDDSNDKKEYELEIERLKYEISKLDIKKVYIGDIDELEGNQIVVFGSNLDGRHGLGMAKIAREKYGAVYGQARGRQDRSYAIITKDLNKPRNVPSRSKLEIRGEITCLYSYACEFPNLDFLIAYRARGTNLNFYSSKEMAQMFKEQPSIPHNIIFEEDFAELVYN